jgi:uncharacterized repeat protein (TIGR01451 family)
VTACALPGAEVEYCLCVTNCSESAAHHVVVRNPLPAHAAFVRASPEPATAAPDLTWRLGTVAGGATQEIRLTLKALGTGDLQNCARLAYEHGVCVTTCLPRTADKAPAPDGGGTGAGANRPPDGTAPQPPPVPKVEEHRGEAKLKLEKSGPKTQYVSTPVPYRLTVSNEGTAPATGVVLTDQLAPGGKVEPATDLREVQPTFVRWNLGTLAPGATRTVEVRVRYQVPDKITNAAEVTADGGLQARAQWTVDLAGAAGLVLALGDLPDPAELGREVRYEVKLRNTGSLPITGLRVVAHVPPELEVTPQTQGPNVYRQDAEGAGQRLTFEPFSLPPGPETETVIYRIVCRAVKAGDVVVRVEVSADQLPAGPVTQEESTTVFDPNPATVEGVPVTAGKAHLGRPTGVK